jgi:hypothetical protein
MPKPWFSPKRYGFGAGLPCSWEGWAVLAAYLAVTGFGLYLSKRFEDPATRLGVLLAAIGPATVILVWVSRARTEGGWRWRWGRDE